MASDLATARARLTSLQNNLRNDSTSTPKRRVTRSMTKTGTAHLFENALPSLRQVKDKRAQLSHELNEEQFQSSRMSATLSVMQSAKLESVRRKEVRRKCKRSTFLSVDAALAGEGGEFD